LPVFRTVPDRYVRSNKRRLGSGNGDHPRAQAHRRVCLIAEVQKRLGVPLHVCDGGIREGAVLVSVEALAA